MVTLTRQQLIENGLIGEYHHDSPGDPFALPAEDLADVGYDFDRTYIG
jgi:hypothetical protein